MALSWKLICLLLVACAHVGATSDKEKPDPTSEPPSPTAPTSEPPSPTAPTSEPPSPTAPTSEPPSPTVPTSEPPAPTSEPTAPTAPTSEPINPTDGTTKPTDAPEPTEKPAPCVLNPCFGGSTCEQVGETRVCLCLAGAYYDYTVQQCVVGKVFPGVLAYDKKYDEAMADKTSEAFFNTSEEINTELYTTFESTAQTKIHRATTSTTSYGYQSVVVNKLSKGEDGKVKATVDIMFQKDSTITTDTFEDKIEGSFEGFTATRLCVSEPCDLDTTKCDEKDGAFNCTCKSEYVPSDYTDRACAACPEGKYVVLGSCEPCSFGYSGFDCKNNWQLILVIVGCVLGALLLITTILLPVVAVTSKKKLKKAKATNYDSKPVKTPQVSNGLAAPRPTPVKAAPASGLSGLGGIPRIPRATANDSWDRNTNLEMVPSNSRQNLIPSSRNSRRYDDDEDTNPYSRPMKPQNNPYAVGRPQINPYSSSQGSSNPYYRH